jgi:hypothetical protein
MVHIFAPHNACINRILINTMNLIERCVTKMSEEQLNMQRTFNHTFKLNEQEEEQLKRLRDVTGLNVSKIVRDALFDHGYLSNLPKADVVKEYRIMQIELTKLLEQESKEIRRIGTNLNQIAWKINKGEMDDIRTVYKELDDIKKILEGIRNNNMEAVEDIWRRKTHIINPI